MSDRYEQVEVTSRAQWRRWLGQHHDTSPGAWVVTYKKDTDGPYVAYADIAEEAIAYGWVDSQPRKLDEQRSQLLVTPRKPKSNWSRVNKERVQRLEQSNLLTGPGRAAVEVARQNGSWSALDDVENLVEPDDLTAALDADPAARRYWDEFPRSTRRGILEWILNAKKAHTRQKRIAETVRLAAEDIRANQPRQPKRSGSS